MRAILVHGGAGPRRWDDHEARLAGVRRAADAGWALLEAGETALTAVEAALRVLEDDPHYDAGLGSYLNADGEIESDASVMDGRDRSFGAVAAVRRVRYASTLARLVMTSTPHGMLAADSAERLAREHGLIVPAVELVTPRAVEIWRAARARAQVAGQGPTGGGTVGAVAIDGGGHVAAGTSSGGMCNKWPGRIGDSPIIGAGTYADDRTGAVSCTGRGEDIMRVCLASVAISRLAAGLTPQAAADGAMAVLETCPGGGGGLVVMAPDGQMGWARNTEQMVHAWRDEASAGSGD